MSENTRYYYLLVFNPNTNAVIMTTLYNAGHTLIFPACAYDAARDSIIRSMIKNSATLRCVFVAAHNNYLIYRLDNFNHFELTPDYFMVKIKKLITFFLIDHI